MLCWLVFEGLFHFENVPNRKNTIFCSDIGNSLFHALVSIEIQQDKNVQKKKNGAFIAQHSTAQRSRNEYH